MGWNIVPKFDYFHHTILRVQETLENPKWTSCLCDEDFIGRIAAVAAATRTSSQACRTLQWYIMCLQRDCLGGDGALDTCSVDENTA